MTPDRVPPHDLTAEASVLSASMLSAQALDKARELVVPSHFYSEAHRRIFEACVTLHDESKPVDITTVRSWLNDRKRLEQVGSDYLVDVLNSVPSLSLPNVAEYAQSVFDKWRLRELIAACHHLAAEGYGDVGPIDAFLGEAERRVHEVTSRRGKEKTVQSMKQAVRGAFEKVRSSYERGRGQITGIATGLERYDNVTGGLHPGELTIVAGRPAMGKTSFVMSIATNIAARKHGVFVFSVEMPNEQLAMRAICSEARVDVRKVRSNAFDGSDWTALTQAAVTASEAPHLYLDEDSSVGLPEMRSRLREYARLIERSGGSLGLVCVDYLQLVTGRDGTERREQEVAEIARGLKALAKEFKVPVLSLAQLNRGVESRTDKRPMLSDLRDSGAIEQDADVVVMLYRDDYYDAESDEPGITELIVAKHRNGPTGIVKVGFEAMCTRFYNLAPDQYPEAS